MENITELTAAITMLAEQTEPVHVLGIVAVVIVVSGAFLTR